MSSDENLGHPNQAMAPPALYTFHAAADHHHHMSDSVGNCSFGQQSTLFDSSSGGTSSKLSTMRSVRPFDSNDEYLVAMTEDLAEWLSSMYKNIEINQSSFLDLISNGAILCMHANNVLRAKHNDFYAHSDQTQDLRLNQKPQSSIPYKPNALPDTFAARDNVSNFIEFARSVCGVRECLMFESDDLILRKNVRNVILCLLEVARYGAIFGMNVPALIELENDIARQIRSENNHFSSFSELQRRSLTGGKDEHKTSSKRLISKAIGCIVPRRLSTSNNNKRKSTAAAAINQQPSQSNERVVSKLHQEVSEIVREMGFGDCVRRVSEGKYSLRISSTKSAGSGGTIVYIRMLRDHVMVNTGTDQWDTLRDFLEQQRPQLFPRQCQKPVGSTTALTDSVRSTDQDKSSSSQLNYSNDSLLDDDELESPVAIIEDDQSSKHSLDSIEQNESSANLDDKLLVCSAKYASNQSIDSINLDDNNCGDPQPPRPSAFHTPTAAICQLRSQMVSGIPVPRRLVLKYRGSRTMPNTPVPVSGSSIPSSAPPHKPSRIPRLTIPSNRKQSEPKSACSTPVQRPRPYKGALTEQIDRKTDSDVPYRVNKAYEWRKKALYFRNYLEETKKTSGNNSSREIDYSGKNQFHYSELKGSEVIYGGDNHNHHQQQQQISSSPKQESPSSAAIVSQFTDERLKKLKDKEDPNTPKAAITMTTTDFSIATSFL